MTYAAYVSLTQAFLTVREDWEGAQKLNGEMVVTLHEAEASESKKEESMTAEETETEMVKPKSEESQETKGAPKASLAPLGSVKGGRSLAPVSGSGGLLSVSVGGLAPLSGGMSLTGDMPILAKGAPVMVEGVRKVDGGEIQEEEKEEVAAEQPPADRCFLLALVFLLVGAQEQAERFFARFDFRTYVCACRSLPSTRPTRSQIGCLECCLY